MEKKHIKILAIVVGLVVVIGATLAFTGSFEDLQGAFKGRSTKTTRTTTTTTSSYNTTATSQTAASSTTSTSTPSTYVWEYDSSYSNRIQGGTLGRIDGANSETALTCDPGQIIMYMDAYADRPGGPADVPGVDGLRVHCAAPYEWADTYHAGTNTWLNNEDHDQIYVSDSTLNDPNNYYGWGAYEGSTVPYNNFLTAGFRKLQAYSLEFPYEFIKLLNIQEMEYNSSPSSATVTPSYNWDNDITFDGGFSVDVTATTGQSTVNCPSSDGDTAYYLSGIQPYTIEVPLRGEVLTGAKIYCTRFNRVAE